MTEQTACDLSEYLSYHYDEIHAYLSGRFGSEGFAEEIISDLLFYLWNTPMTALPQQAMQNILMLAGRLGNYRKQRQKLIRDDLQIKHYQVAASLSALDGVALNKG
ncbi:MULTISPECIES: hypothetical protein [Nitrincola]|uniref:Uncharacterized protein n=1 Tax=Nitrincola nitratireducens TaxID=1229521 RepID=W9VNS4_9GAMM|nr:MULTISPECIES: hypothetical protein [Nitrincola]EXJ12135.1 hypothetical protein D791_01024 [Nitrincola nitratireducens]